MEVLLFMSHQKNLAIGTRPKNLSSAEVIELIISGEVLHFIDLARPYSSLFFLGSSKYDWKLRFLDGFCNVASQRFFDITESSPGYFAFFDKLNVEIEVLICLFTASCFF